MRKLDFRASPIEGLRFGDSGVRLRSAPLSRPPTGVEPEVELQKVRLDALGEQPCASWDVSSSSSWFKSRQLVGRNGLDLCQLSIVPLSHDPSLRPERPDTSRAEQVPSSAMRSIKTPASSYRVVCRAFNNTRVTKNVGALVTTSGQNIPADDVTRISALLSTRLLVSAPTTSI